MKNTVKYTLSVLSTALLMACGGGGGGTADSGDKGDAGDDQQKPVVAVLTGNFVDAPVEGLQYITATQNGVTDSLGTFKYVLGERIAFKLYGKTISTPMGFSFLTPFDLGDTSVDVNYSVNLIRFLMALDEDGNPSNGIKLPAYSGTLSDPQNNFFNRSIQNFGADTDGRISKFLGAAANGRKLPSVEAAVKHFNESLASKVPSAVANYTLNFSGKTATSVVKDSRCTNNAAAGFKYNFYDTYANVEGSDGLLDTNGNGTCQVLVEYQPPWQYTALTTAGSFLQCLPKCTYSQLNQITYIPSTEDTDVDKYGKKLERTIVEWTWHTPYSNKITKVRAIISGNLQSSSLSTFTEVVTLN